MRSIRVLIADESPVMRRWYAAAVGRVAQERQIDECENGWHVLLKLSEDRPYDLVVASKSLSGPSGAHILAMLRSVDARVPFVLVAPFCDDTTRALVQRLHDAALVEDPLDSVWLAEAAESLLRSFPAPLAVAGKVRRAALRAHRRQVQRSRALTG